LVQLWLYDPGLEPRLIKTLPNPADNPLATVLLGLPEWNDEKEDA
jgi:hypothetical protein